MTAFGSEFNGFQRQLNSELQLLSSEAKKRSSAIKQASDKSIEILRTVRNYEELSDRSEFLAPFLMSCSSKNAKLTSISMQCLQRLSSTPSLSKDKLSDVLEAFILATQLALDMKLKVLQVLPIFFKNYAYDIHGSLCTKMLRCCSSLLQSANKAPMVVGTASATLQQLIDEIFERLVPEEDHGEANTEKDKKFDVLIGNNESIKVDVYRYDANRLFADLCSSFELTDHSGALNRVPLLDVRDLPLDYGLEILESVMKNTESLFLIYEDLQFLLRTKTVPFLLRCMSSSKSFPTVLRSYRCIKLLIKKEFLSILELEMEVVLSLLIHSISADTDSPHWKKVLSLELFLDASHDFELLCDIFMSYDNYPDRKHILTSLLREFLRLLASEDMQNCLCEAPIVKKMDMPIISSETFDNRTQFVHMLDKTHPPSVTYTYIIWLILNISNEWSNGLSLRALEVTETSEGKEVTEHYENLRLFYSGIFQDLYSINKMFLYSTSLDTPLFHSLIRAFQKLAHAAGILSMDENLNKCLRLFSLSILMNETLGIEASKIDQPLQSAVLNPMNESHKGSNAPENTQPIKKQLLSRNINQRRISLFRALISLSVSLGQALSPDSWTFVLRTWQWISYYLYGPSADFMEDFYLEDVPRPPAIGKNEVISIENSIRRLLESTITYSDCGFRVLAERLIYESNQTIAIGSGSAVTATDNDPTYPFNQGVIQDCCYNKTFFITQLSELAIFNFDRFLSTPNGWEKWKVIASYFTRLISDRAIPAVAIRLYASKALTDIIRKTCIEIGEIEDQNLRSEKFQKSENMIIGSLIDSIDSLKVLEITKDTIYSGVVRVESEILLQILSTLKDVLNEFGDILSSTWSTVFQIVNSPFEWDTKDMSNLLAEHEDGDDGSLLIGIIQKHTDMIQVSFDVFKLISDDFLQALPLDVLKFVIDTIVHFVTQKQNLNISFSSISQFWLIGDYLRTQEKEEQKSCPDGVRLEFTKEIQAGNLEKIISADDSLPYAMYNGLWLYLLKKLIECSKDERSEVKNGAIQTFFRIVDSHAAYFPQWDLIFLEVIKPLLTAECDKNQLAVDVEFWNHTLVGLVKLYPSCFTNFHDNDSAVNQWLLFLEFLQSLFSSGSTEISYVAIMNYRNLLKAMAGINDLPAEVLNKSISIWSNYNLVYNNLSLSNTQTNKTGYDCINELIVSFPYLYEIITKYQGMSVEFVEKALGLFNSAVRYPLLPEHTKDNTKPSSLQSAVLKGLNIFDKSQDSEVEILILYQLSMIITLPFETREKIERKLLPKLPQSSVSRIPTFEAISAQALKSLNDRLELESDDAWSFLQEKHMIKVYRNLGEVVRRKSLIAANPNSEIPIYEIASQLFRKLSSKMFGALSTPGVSDKVQDDLSDVFINVAISFLRRTEPVVDKKTDACDADEFSKFRDLLLEKEVISFIRDEQLTVFVSAIWSGSFLYEKDEIEEEILGESESLVQLAVNLSCFDFTNTAGLTIETPVLSKTHCSVGCLKDLIHFVQLSDEEYKLLRTLCMPYLVSRIAFVLRRFISNESLVGRAPIPKIRKVELEIMIRGLHNIIESLLQNPRFWKGSMSQSLEVLRPLILRAIPISHKLKVLQKEILELSLGFTKLLSDVERQ